MANKGQVYERVSPRLCDYPSASILNTHQAYDPWLL